MISPTIHEAFADLFHWCSGHDFAGYDPFDALNSKAFQATPLRNSATARLLWTQAVKRSPFNLRPLLLVPPEPNAKGMALFVLAALAEYRRTKSPEAEQQTLTLLERLVSLRIETAHGVAWGYNFDWQSRVFFAPRGTPTIVPTAFAARALNEAAAVFGDDSYLDLVRGVCEFIVHELPRSIENRTEVCFGYTPNAATRVFNASLLGAEILAGTNNGGAGSDYELLSIKAARYVVNQQQQNGSWAYGAEATQSWIDNFHTAYVLSSLKAIIDAVKTEQTEDFMPALKRGYDFWKKSFFLADGETKYYHDTLYPIDTHAAASAIVCLLDFKESDPEALSLAERVANWSIRHLRDRQGFFYYQRHRFHTVRTPFMRWTQAWMLYALARLLEVQAKNS